MWMDKDYRANHILFVFTSYTNNFAVNNYFIDVKEEMSFRDPVVWNPKNIKSKIKWFIPGTSCCLSIFADKMYTSEFLLVNSIHQFLFKRSTYIFKKASSYSKFFLTLLKSLFCFLKSYGKKTFCDS